jgi:Phage derived protein Gp49-like (DUF891)
MKNSKVGGCGCHEQVGTPGDCVAVDYPLAQIGLDPKRFQNRTDAFSELSAEAVARHYDPNKFDPVVLWRDPAQQNRAFMLSGHSRLEGMHRRRAATIPARFFSGTEAEAVQFARVDANRAATAENLAEDLAAYKLMRDGDEARELKPTKKAELNRVFKGKSTKLEAWSHLQPGGLFLNALSQDDRSQFPYLEKFALWVGQLRAQEPDFSNTHETDCFNFLYADRKHQQLSRDEFEELVLKRLAWGKPRLFPECERGGCVELKDLAKRGSNADTYREIEALAKFRETITHRLRSTDRSLRVYTENEREKLKEQGALIDQELKRLRRDVNQVEEAPGLFGPNEPRTFLLYTDARGRQPVLDFLDQDVTRTEANYIGRWLDEAAEWPVLQYPQFKRFAEFETWLGELRINRFRIFVHRLPGNVFLLVHAFKKKTDQTPKAEITKALNRIKDHYSRNSR